MSTESRSFMVDTACSERAAWILHLRLAFNDLYGDIGRIAAVSVPHLQGDAASAKEEKRTSIVSRVTVIYRMPNAVSAFCPDYGWRKIGQNNRRLVF